MKILILVAGGRAGSDLFQSLLDEHSQILQFPGILEINNNFLDLINLKNYQEILAKFIKQYPHFFNSKLNKVERHDCLGKNRNKFYTVSTKTFSKNFLNLCKKNKKIKKFDIIKYLHFAYFLTRKKKIQNKKIIFIHAHHIAYAENFINKIESKNVEIIHTIRNPILSINSALKSWLRYEKGKSFLFV